MIRSHWEVTLCHWTCQIYHRPPSLFTHLISKHELPSYSRKLNWRDCWAQLWLALVSVFPAVVSEDARTGQLSFNKEFRYNPGIPGYLSKENQNSNSKRYLHHHARCSIIYKIQDMETPKCPSVGEWVKKMWDIYIFCPEGLQPCTRKNRHLLKHRT